MTISSVEGRARLYWGALNRTASRPLRLRWNLHRKLIIVSFSVLLPLFFFGYYLVQENVSATKRQILNNSLATADILVFQIDDFVDSTEKLLQTLAQTQAVQNANEFQTSLLLRDAAVVHDAYELVFATRKDGTVYATSNTTGADTGPSFVSDSDYLGGVIARGKTTVYVRLPSVARDGPMVNIIVPVTNSDGQGIGALAAWVSLANLQRRLSNTQIQLQGAHIVVASTTGTALVYPDWQYVTDGRWLGDFPPVLASRLYDSRGTIEYVDPSDGQSYLAAYARANAVSWAVVVAYPANLAYSRLEEVAQKGLFGLGVSAVLAFLIGLFLTSRFTRPIGELSKRTKTVLGSLAPDESQPEVRDEVQQLALAFDTVYANLSRREDELAGIRREVEQKVKELQELAVRASQAQEEERKRLALEVHDGVAQLISGALFNAQVIEESLASDPSVATRRMHATQTLLTQAMAEVRRVMAGLYPTTLEGGLVTAVQTAMNSLQEVFDLQCQLCVEGIPRELSAEAETAIYGIVREGLHNVRKHAQASRVEVVISYEPAALKVKVLDDGQGFDPEITPLPGSKGLGVLGMRQRAQSIGARFEVRSRPGQGTSIDLEVPLEEAESRPRLRIVV